MANQFKSKRSLLWLGGMAALVLGVLLAAVLLPMTAPKASGPDVRVPKMENVPPPDAPKLKLDVEKKQ